MFRKPSRSAMSRFLSRMALTVTLLLATLWWAAGPVHQAHAATVDTVTNCNDYGSFDSSGNFNSYPGTLRYVVEHAAAGDTIIFTCSGTITLSTLYISLFQNLTIDGSGQAVTLDGGGINGACALGVLQVRYNASVTLRHLTIANCYTGSLSNGSSGVGAVEVDPGSTLTVSNSTFSGNVFGGNGGGSGGIVNDGTLNVNDSTFSGNRGTNGGGILNFHTLNVSNSTFSGNDASGTGGGIENDGTATIGNSTFSGNTGSGGGIENHSTATISNSTFSGNAAADGGGGALGNDGTATISNSTFSGNTALMAGAILSGVFVTPYVTSAGSTTLINTILANNTGALDGACDGSTPINQGGNLADAGSCGVPTVSTASLNLGTLADNGGPTLTVALGSGSVAIDFASCLQPTDQRGAPRPDAGEAKCDSGAYESGAAPLVPNPVVTTCDEATLRAALGEATPDSTVTFTCSGTITLTSGGGGTITLTKNVTINGNGHKVTLSGGDAVTVLDVSPGVTAALNDLTISNGRSDVLKQNSGGGITNEGMLTVTNSTISGNQSFYNGGGIFSLGPLTIVNSTISGNRSLYNSGGAITNEGPLTIVNSTISGNSAPSGGGIYNDLGSVTVPLGRAEMVQFGRRIVG